MPAPPPDHDALRLHLRGLTAGTSSGIPTLPSTELKGVYCRPVSAAAIFAAGLCAATAWAHLLYATFLDWKRDEYPRDLVETALSSYAFAPLPIVFFSLRLHALVSGLLTATALFLAILGTSGGRPMRLGTNKTMRDKQDGYLPTAADRRARLLFTPTALLIIAVWVIYLFNE